MEPQQITHGRTVYTHFTEPEKKFEVECRIMPGCVRALLICRSLRISVACSEWWTARSRLPRAGRLAPGWEQGLVFLGIGFIIYLALAVERYRKSR